MAITGFNVTSFSSGTDASSYATSSITPSPGRLVLAFVENEHASTAALPTLSGCGLTWVQVATAVSNANFRRATLFRALGSSTSAGAVTADFSAATQIGCSIIVDEFEGVDQGGTNGSAAVVQSSTVADDSGVGAATSITLSAFGSSSNVGYAGFYLNASATLVVGSGFTSLGSATHSTPSAASLTEYKLNATGPSVTSGGVADRWFGVGVEIKASPVVANHLTTYRGQLSASTYSTSSITPGANRLVLCAVGSQASVTAPVPTVTGCGLTWVQIATVVSGSSPRSSNLFAR